MAIITTDDRHYHNIAAKIREKTGWDTTYTPSEMPGALDEVYEAGKTAGTGEMWDRVQDHGNREAYNAAFANWDCEYIRPKHKVAPKEAASTVQTFFNNKGLKRVEKEYFDFSNCDRATYNSGSHYYTFGSCPSLEVIEDVGLKNVYCFGSTFAWCGALHTIECIYPDENTLFDGTFVGCYELVHLRVNGTIGQNGVDVSWSTKLDKESITSIFHAFSAATAGLSVTLSEAAVNKAFEEQEGANNGNMTDEWLAFVESHPGLSISLL